METQTPFRPRISERFACDVPVNACTTLETREARVVDVSMHGAQVRMEQPYAAGTRIHLDVEGHYVWADVQWSEIDRIGVKFVTALQADHRLSTVITEQRQRIARTTRQQQLQPRGFGRKAA